MTPRQVANQLPPKPLASVPRPRSSAPPPPSTKPVAPTKPPLRSSVPRPDGARRSREPLRFHPAPAPLQEARRSPAAHPLKAQPSRLASSARERLEPRAPTLLATPVPAAVVPLPSRRVPPPLPVRTVDRVDSPPDTELTDVVNMSDLLDDADVEDDVEEVHIDVLLDEEPGATTRTAPPPEPSTPPSKKATLAIVGGLVVSIAAMAAALLVLEGRPATSPSAATSNVALATLSTVRTATAPLPPATAMEPALAAKTAKTQRAHPNKQRATPPKAQRATSKRDKPHTSRALVKKTGKAPAKK
jgi:hypothetical protein